MARTQTRVNGQPVNPLPMNQPITPVMTQEQLLKQVDMEREIARLKAENEALAKRNAQGGGLTCKRSEKGAVSVYGLGRWPVTLYLEQWLKLLAIADQIKAFIKANESTLSHKED